MGCPDFCSLFSYPWQDDCIIRGNIDKIWIKQFFNLRCNLVGNQFVTNKSVEYWLLSEQSASWDEMSIFSVESGLFQIHPFLLDNCVTFAQFCYKIIFLSGSMRITYCRILQKLIWILFLKHNLQYTIKTQ
jgi:hypothetical protein